MPDPVTPNMGLTIPIVGTTVGPTYAQEINADLSVLDQHDHSPGAGVPIPVAGININANLPFGGYSATGLLSARFSPQGSPQTPANSLSVGGVDLYYTDSNGNQVRLTQSGSVAGTPGSIANLVAPASASYSAITKTFTWQSDVNTPANMDLASVVLRNLTAGGNGLTLQPPTLSSNYALTLPVIPPVNAFLGLDTSGNITTIASVSLGIGRSMQAEVGQIAATPVPSITTTATTPTFNIGSATATVTTTGRPVFILPTPGVNSSSTFIIAASHQDALHFPRFDFTYTRGSTSIATYRVGFSTATPFSGVTASGDFTMTSTPNGYAFIPPPFLDVIGAGTYTYGMKITDTTIGSATYLIQNVSLVAYEL